ncbi:MAG: hypothetical protein LBB85_02385 [Dysgonamonadaceae bacterium]|jgi:hypothetical protein|nr:hypothetical protein [Dysgonamonadaceae bacterium]
MITIYSSSDNTKRLEFIAEHLFRDVLGAEFQITSDALFYRTQTGPCINYSNETFNYGIRIFPQGLLFETGMHPIEDLQIAEWHDLFCFFYSGQGDLPFDVFAASFYLLSLYEEYFPSSLDEHGRWDHRNSLLFRHKVLDIPVIDRWAYRLKAALENAGFSTAGFRLRNYRAVSTYDIDYPFLYRYKGFIKNIGGGLRDLLKKNFKAVNIRLSALFRRSEDPYMEALRLIHTTEMQANRSYYLFVLLGKKGKYGRSTLYSPQAYYRYLRRLSGVCIGLHPSYQTQPAQSYPTLMTEKRELENILQQSVVRSRQHFLQMQVPGTFQRLLQAGICEDFTLAFAKMPGFRSGTAVPHRFYDLQKDEVTDLCLHPTVMMDSTLIFHLKLTPEAALEKIQALIDACKQSGGDYLSLWHNSNLAGSPDENPWIRVFIESHRYAISAENH